MDRDFLTSGAVFQRALCPFFMCLSTLSVNAVARAESPDQLVWTLHQSVGVLDSQWREQAPSGSTLVKEGGRLDLIGTALTVSYWSWDVTFHHDQLSGPRCYEGLTNRGQLASSRSDIRGGTSGLSLLKSFSPTWAWGMALDHVATQRDIRSSGIAQGYPENYSYTIGKLGVQHRWLFSSGLQLYTTAWLGRSFEEKLHLRLPGFDPADLRLGRGRTAELSWRLVKSFEDSKWQATLNVGHQIEHFSAGHPVTLFKGGRIAGSANQPKWRHSRTQLSAEVSYGF